MFAVQFEIPTDMSMEGNLVKFNVNDTGFYRVTYPDEIWTRFATSLESSGPSVVRYSILCVFDSLIRRVFFKVDQSQNSVVKAVSEKLQKNITCITKTFIEYTIFMLLE